ncbi:LLM class flavin-dependent oxidoreductase [Phreatobacter sp. AB_2022a]|uniref:LLM class flavin-dependent oxidoreductase n=1 Tax=Phreatobacter sp. AB_2022a TaxID=3003134 RepID=UPI002286E71E|nr:LLM class flavin-dependent oxidoreductase [Phreatobacter sp. AB_2022a]MCZ0738052.1 LLM class flavin-dependent oxidoreductase [Phreatobacter sp. AB_2022a]
MPHVDQGSPTTDVGVFLPIFSGGWIKSTASPRLPGSYPDNLAITLAAEAMGFDFAMSAAVWRGYGGESEAAKYALESMMCMAGLAQATSRIKLWATAHMMIWPPVVVSKMIATLDQIARGRIGLNVVTGSKPNLMKQMGLWQDLGHDERYDLADEWVGLVRRLWTEDSVTYAGKFYTTDDCQMFPKPSVMPPLICAGMSDRGFRFTAQNCDVAFLSAQDNDKFYGRALRAKEIATELGNPGLRTFGLFPLVIGKTDEAARDRLASYNAAVDRQAVLNMMDEYNEDKDVRRNEGAQVFIQQAQQLSAVMPNTMAGSAETLAWRVAETVRRARLDGVMVILADYDEDLRTFGHEILPMMAAHGVTTRAGGVAAGRRCRF